MCIVYERDLSKHIVSLLPCSRIVDFPLHQNQLDPLWYTIGELDSVIIKYYDTLIIQISLVYISELHGSLHQQYSVEYRKLVVDLFHTWDWFPPEAASTCAWVGASASSTGPSGLTSLLLWRTCLSWTRNYITLTQSGLVSLQSAVKLLKEYFYAMHLKTTLVAQANLVWTDIEWHPFTTNTYLWAWSMTVLPKHT